MKRSLLVVSVLGRALGILLLVVVLGGAISSAMFNAGWGEDAVKNFINTVEYIVNTLASRGVNVTVALEYLNEAKSALDEGDLVKARALAMEALRTAGHEAKVQLNVTIPSPIGVVKLVSVLEGVIEGLKSKVNKTDVLEALESKLSKAKELLSKGNVSGAIKLVINVSRSLRQISIEEHIKHMEKLGLKLMHKYREMIREHVRRFVNQSLVNIKHVGEAKHLIRKHMPDLGNIFMRGALNGVLRVLIKINMTLDTVIMPDEIRMSLKKAVSLSVEAIDLIEEGIASLTNADFEIASKYLSKAEELVNESINIVKEVKLSGPYAWIPELLEKCNLMLLDIISKVSELKAEIPGLPELPKPGEVVSFEGVVLKVDGDEALVLSFEKVVCIMVVGYKCPPAIWRLWKVDFSEVNVKLMPGMKIYVEGVLVGFDELTKIPIVKATEVKILSKGVTILPKHLTP